METDRPIIFVADLIAARRPIFVVSRHRCMTVMTKNWLVLSRSTLSSIHCCSFFYKWLEICYYFMHIF